MNNLVWFRNDLRTQDNTSLFEACKKAGAETVAASVVYKSVDNFYKVPVYSSGWTEIWHRGVV